MQQLKNVGHWTRMLILEPFNKEIFQVVTFWITLPVLILHPTNN